MRLKESDISRLDEDSLERFIRIKRSAASTVDYDGSHLAFMQNCWLSYEPFIIGFHTRKICEAIDRALDDFRHGKSTYLLINVHHRVGKSTIISRYAPAHFIGEFPNHEVIQCSYSQKLATNFSTFGRNVVRSDKYKALYPKIALSSETNKKDDWVIVDDNGYPTGGRVYASGLLSGLTGNGYSFGSLDDYCRGRAQAESEVFRQNTWESFTNDFLTRASPVNITIVLATQWHWDDISGRIKSEMDINPDFPRFKCLSFPARAKDYKGEGKYPGEYLFEERLGKQWYRNQYATLGKYSAAALLDCNPLPRTGGRLSLDGICYVDEMPGKKELHWARIWDMAHTAKQRSGNDPDWTSGTRMAFERRKGEAVPYLYIADVARTRAGAVERDRMVKSKADGDGVYIDQVIENTLDSKDVYEYIKKAMPENKWEKLEIRGDKGARATPLESIFETPGHVIVKRGEWNDAWLNEILRFDGTGREHDDQVDNLSAGYQYLVLKDSGFDADFCAEMANYRSRSRQ